MKIAGVVSLNEVKFGPIIYKGDLKQSIEKLAELGYDGIEISLRDPGRIDAEKLNRILKKNNIELASIATGPSALMDGLTLTSSDGETRKKAERRIMDHIELASLFSAKIIIGGMKGNLPEGREADAENWLVDGFRKCSDFAKEKDVTLLLETINRYEMNWLNSVSEGISVLKKIDRKNVLLHIDTFHMNIEEPSMSESIELSKGLLGYVHFADSNRWAPGYGHIDFRKVISTLRKIEYNDYVSFEILPLPDPDAAAQTGIRTILPLLRQR